MAESTPLASLVNLGSEPQAGLLLAPSLPQHTSAVLRLRCTGSCRPDHNCAFLGNSGILHQLRQPMETPSSDRPWRLLLRYPMPAPPFLTSPGPK